MVGGGGGGERRVRRARWALAAHPPPPAPLGAQESTLKSVLSALWNLSAHSTENKAAICQVDGALGFLVRTLTYKCQSNSLAVIESGGGILRNVSSLIATREDYRSPPLPPPGLWDGGGWGGWALGEAGPQAQAGVGLADPTLLGTEDKP